jgi:Transposase domain (DUF772)
MRGRAGFFDVDERLRQISAKGDSLERLNAVIDFELFGADLERAVPHADRIKGGQPAFDHVLMFKTLILQANHNLSDERTECLIRDRLSFKPVELQNALEVCEQHLDLFASAPRGLIGLGLGDLAGQVARPSPRARYQASAASIACGLSITDKCAAIADSGTLMRDI